MIIPWVILSVFIAALLLSYLKKYTLKARLTCIAVLFMISVILLLPIFSLSILTLTGLYGFL